MWTTTRNDVFPMQSVWGGCCTPVTGVEPKFAKFSLHTNVHSEQSYPHLLINPVVLEPVSLHLFVVLCETDYIGSTWFPQPWVMPPPVTQLRAAPRHKWMPIRNPLQWPRNLQVIRQLQMRHPATTRCQPKPTAPLAKKTNPPIQQNGEDGCGWSRCPSRRRTRACLP